ncbi:uncharacterized protein LOC34617337 [Cyclospora cayetanensis]|uniref:Uncharacterized protein LOC34617337 n=1 Tax=Cyclospora cayetanensis TaxID=88456 RepID=A0A6P6RZY8_9EIME|nr:uncharacterized protein LOC34617337 [Cyclospora cayetanensis]
MEETQLLSALASLFSPTDPTTQRQADEWLRGWQQSVGAWEASLELLALREPPLSDDVVCFAAQTLRTKCLFDLYQLPPEAPVALICRIAAALKQHHANRAAVTQLSLALAAVSLSQQQDSPLALLLRACGLDTLQPQQNSADARLLLLLLTHLGEEAASSGLNPPPPAVFLLLFLCVSPVLQVLQFAVSIRKNGCKSLSLSVLESTSSDTAETAAAAACIAHLLKTWGRFTGAASATTAAGEGVSPLLQIAVKHSIGPLQRMLATSAAVTANGEGRGGSAAGAAPSADPETLAYAVHAVAATCRVAVPLLLRRTHVDAELQQLLETLAAAVALPRTLGLLHYRQQFPQQQQQQQHPQDEDDLTSDYEAAAFLSAEAVRFFCHLRYDIENAERQQPQQEEEVHPQSKQALIQVYRHLTDEIVKQMQLPYAQLSNEDIEEVFCFREQLLLLLEDAAALLGAEVSLGVAGRIQQLLQQHQLQQQQQTAAAAGESFEMQLECLLVALNNIFSYSSSAAAVEVVLPSAVAAVQSVLTSSPPLTRAGVACRVAAVKFLQTAQSSLDTDPGSLQAAVGLLASQVSAAGAVAAGGGAAGESLEAATAILRHRAAAALEDICRHSKSCVSPQTIQDLAARTMAYWLVLEAVCCLVAREEEDTRMLSMMEGLCRPCITAVEEVLTSGSEARQDLCTRLDSLGYGAWHSRNSTTASCRPQLSVQHAMAAAAAAAAPAAAQCHGC